MELYVGGMSQGKLKLVCEKIKMEEDSNQICDGADCSLEDLFTSPVINHLHLFIRRLFIEEPQTECGLPVLELNSYLAPIEMDKTDPAHLAEVVVQKLMDKNPAAIILCNEIGYGIVPMDKTDRLYRETVGRCLCRLAAYSERVVRVVCGLGMKIK